MASPPELPIAPDTIIATENQNGVTTGQMDASFAVTPDGKATYRIPLWVPPGRNGLQPDLALQYDSSAGYGFLGMGWSLTGLSKITLCPKTFSDDGRVEAIQFDGSDPFCLNGERLVPVQGAHGQDNTEYRTRHDTFAKIVIHGTDDLGPLKFEVRQKDGRIFTFEPDTPTFRIAVVTHDYLENPEDADIVEYPVRYSWSLVKVEDRAGNTMEIDYVRLTEEGVADPPFPITGVEFLPSEIRYTGSTDPTQPQALRSVRFSYGRHPSKLVRYMSGVRFKWAARLIRIEMWGPNPKEPELLRLYDLFYRADSITSRSLLAGLFEYDGLPIGEAPVGTRPGTSKKPHIFNWELGTTSFKDIDTGITDVKITPGGRSNLPGRLLALDLDGDGRDDIIYVTASSVDGYVFRLANADGQGFGPQQTTGMRLPNCDDPRFCNGRPSPLDANMDGRMDLMTYDDSQLIPGAGCCVKNILNISTLDAATGATQLVAVPDDPRFENVELVEVADLDGDRLPDLFTAPFADPPQAERRWSYWHNTGGVFQDPVPQDELLPDNHRILDLDGAGAMEILSTKDIGNIRQHYWAFRLAQTDPPSVEPYQLTNLFADQAYIFADINGDGLVDAVAHSTQRTDNNFSETAINSGNGFFPPKHQNLFDTEVRSSVIRALDYDADGQQELIERFKPFPHLDGSKNEGQQDDPMRLLKWDGKKFVELLLPEPFKSTWTQVEEIDVFEVLDINGDGLDDIVMMNNGHLHIYIHEGKKPDMLTDITDSLGSTTTIRYEPLSNGDVYQRTQECAYPLYASAGGRWVVAEVVQDDGRGSANFYRYTYEDGRTDLRGQGFLGFLAGQVTHENTNITTRTTYDQSTNVAGLYPFAGLPLDIETRTPLEFGGEHVHTVRTTYEARVGVGASNQVVFPFARTIEVEEHEVRSGTQLLIRHITTTQDFDEFGNLIHRDALWSDGSRDIYRATYDPRPDDWLVNLLDFTEQVSSTAEGTLGIRRTAYEYDSRGLLSRQIVEPGAKTASGYLPLNPQPDGITTLFISYERYPEGTIQRVTLEETMAFTGQKRIIDYFYDSQEHMFLVASVNTLGHRVRVSYHPGLGVPSIMEDANGIQTAFRYDGFGRIRFQSSPDGNYRTIAYLAQCNLPPGVPSVSVSSCTLVTYNSGPEVLTTYDTLGRPVVERTLARVDDQAILRQIEYDLLGRAARVSRPYFENATPFYSNYEYDFLGRMRTVHHADSTTVNYGYIGREYVVVDENGHRRTYGMNQRGNIELSIEDTALSATTYEYGPFDTLTRITDAAGNITELHYDRRGRCIEEFDQDAGRRQLRYNSFGEVAQEVTGAQTTRYFYDEVGRLFVTERADGITLYLWDTAQHGVGKLGEIWMPHGIRMTYTFDAIGRLTTRTWNVNGQQYEIGITYDGVGRLDTVAYPQVAGSQPPLKIRYHYGIHGDLRRVADAISGLAYWTKLDSDASDVFGREQLGNGTITERFEDPARPGLLQRIISSSAGGQRIQELTYGFDAKQNLVRRHDGLLGIEEGFTYDALDRLQVWTNTRLSGHHQTVKWEYDAIGNIVKREMVVGSGIDLIYTYGQGSAGPHAVTTINQGTYQYDERGNQIKAPGRSVSYTSFNLPSRITVANETFTFQYDGEGRRVRKASTSADGEVISVGGLYERRTGHGNLLHVFFVKVWGRVVAQLIWGEENGQVISQRVLYLHGDNLGSVDVITDDIGNVVKRLTYEPFGARLDPSQPNAKEPSPDISIGFTSHIQEDRLGLIDMRGRWYDPAIGRFLSPDPVRLVTYAGQSLNPYSYVLNNPLSWRDPTGMQGEQEDDTEDPFIGTVLQFLGNSSSDSWSTLDQAVDAAHSAVSTSGGKVAIDDGSGGAGISDVSTTAPNNSRRAKESLAGLRFADNTFVRKNGTLTTSGVPTGQQFSRDFGPPTMNARTSAAPIGRQAPMSLTNLQGSPTPSWEPFNYKKFFSYVTRAYQLADGESWDAWLDLKDQRQTRPYDLSLASAEEYLFARVLGESPFPTGISELGILIYNGVKFLHIAPRAGEGPVSPFSPEQYHLECEGLTEGMWIFWRNVLDSLGLPDDDK